MLYEGEEFLPKPGLRLRPSESPRLTHQTARDAAPKKSTNDVAPKSAEVILIWQLGETVEEPLFNITEWQGVLKTAWSSR